MKDGYSSEDEPSTSSSAPLFSIGFAVLVVLLVPVLLYSVGPEGPIKEGDIVFATDRVRVRVFSSGEGLSASTCFLEPRMQLVVQNIDTASEQTMIAQPIANEYARLPMCLPGKPVIVHPHQVTLQADVWGGLGDTLSYFFSGS